MPAVTPIQVRLPDEERDALDNYRREQRNPPSRAQAARELIRRSLGERQNASAAGGTKSEHASAA
jgi:hypothetical protein